jgi:hypothetical protein
MSVELSVAVEPDRIVVWFGYTDTDDERHEQSLDTRVTA